MSTTQADFKAACERRGLTPSQELFSFWQDARWAGAEIAAAELAHDVPATPIEERLAFETCEDLKGLNIAKAAHNQYRFADTRNAWRGWKARAAITATKE